MAKTSTPKSGARVAFDWLLVAAVAAVTVGLAALGAIGYPFELSGRVGDRPRAVRFNEYAEGGAPVWFADHIAWFAFASVALAVTVMLVSTIALPKSRRARQLTIVAYGVTAAVNVGVFATLLVSWIAGIPASTDETFAGPEFYILPTILSAILAVVFAGVTLLARRIAAAQKR